MEAIRSSGTDIRGPETFSQIGGRFILLGGLSLRVWSYECLSFLGFLLEVGLGSSISRTPSLATRVSILLRSFKGTSFVTSSCGCAELSVVTNCSAWSLCCQQKKAAAPESFLSPLFPTDTIASTPFVAEAEDRVGDFAVAILRRHGRPLDVIPLHVVAGFLESERGRRDSGV